MTLNCMKKRKPLNVKPGLVEFYPLVDVDFERSEDRLALLRTWVMRDGNASACEAAIVLEKKNSTKLDRDRELLKVADMVRRGFSEWLSLA